VLEQELGKLKIGGGGSQKRGRSYSVGSRGRGGPPKKKGREIDTRAMWVESTAGPVQRLEFAPASGSSGLWSSEASTEAGSSGGGPTEADPTSNCFVQRVFF